MIPFGIHKGKHYSEVPLSYILFILGYKEKNRCVLPKNKANFSYRYPELYKSILDNIDKCLRCDNDIVKDSDNIHLRILCKSCYNKHEKNIIYKKMDKEKNTDTEKELYCDEYNILNNLVEKYNLVKLDKFIGRENFWKQEKPCAICNKECYGTSKYSIATKTNYNLCSDCFCIKGYIESDLFDINIYNNYLEKLSNIISSVSIINLESTLVTKKLTEICIELCNELNLQYICEKKCNNGIFFTKNRFYDLEISYNTTKFIIEIDRTYNDNTILKIEDALYPKCIWIRWGSRKNIHLDYKNNKCDIIKLPLNNINNKWNSKDLSLKIKKNKKKTLFDYGVINKIIDL